MPTGSDSKGGTRTSPTQTLNSPSAAMASLSGPMEAPLKVTGSTVKLVALEYSVLQSPQMRYMKVSGSKTSKQACVYSDRIKVSISRTILMRLRVPQR